MKILKYKDLNIEPERVLIKYILKLMGIESLFEVLEFMECERGVANESLYGNEEGYYDIEGGEQWESVKELCREIAFGDEPWNMKMLCVNGSDLIKAGVTEGEKIGKTLEHLLDIVIKDPSLNTKEKLLKEIEVKQ